jgi:hypothetical protein
MGTGALEHAAALGIPTHLDATAYESAAFL